MGSSCCQPARLQPDLPPKLRRAIFSLEHGKLPAFPPFLSDLLPAWPPNLFPFLPPSPIISDFRMFALAPRPPARSLHGWILSKKKTQKRSFLQAGPDSPGQDCLLSTLSKRNWSNLGLGRQILSSNDFPSKPQMHFVSI